ncbi:TIGR03752 family integrating conjugative element protein [Vibrio sp. PNB22_3_1]
MNKSYVMVACGLFIVATFLWSVGSGGDVKQTQVEEDSLASLREFNVGSEDTGAMSDSTADTLRTLIAENKSREREFKDLRDVVRELRQTVQLSSSRSVDGIREELSALVEKIRSLEDEVTQVRESVSELKSNSSPEDVELDLPLVAPASEVSPPGNGGMGVELPDFNALIPNLAVPELGLKNPLQRPDLVTTPPKSGGYVWLEPTDVIITEERGEIVKTYPSQRERELIEAVAEVDNVVPVEADGIKRVYTIPQGATFVDSVALSAILGRVPKEGRVVDPFKFKVMVGAKNLASNGHVIPNLDNMVLSGVAQGDYTLSCASGVITSALFTFNDGTVRAISTTRDDPLGFIADRYGVPCVRGEYLTNAAEYISTRGLLSTATSVADALAQGEVTSISEGGSVANVVTGDSGIYAAGKGVGDGIQEVSDWVDSRQQSAFDAVFVPVGELLSVHIEQTLEIDYEIDGRKLQHKERDGLL